MSKILKFSCVLILLFIVSISTSNADCDGQVVTVWGEDDSDTAIQEARQNCCGMSVVEVHDLSTGTSTFVGVYSDGANSSCANDD